MIEGTLEVVVITTRVGAVEVVVVEERKKTLTPWTLQHTLMFQGMQLLFNPKFRHFDISQSHRCGL